VDRAFDVAVVRVCDSVPPDVTTVMSLPVFQRQHTEDVLL